MEVYVNRYGTQSATKTPKTTTSNAGIAPCNKTRKEKTKLVAMSDKIKITIRSTN